MANEHENPEQQTDAQSRSRRAQQRPTEEVASEPVTKDVYVKKEVANNGCGELQVLAFGYLTSDGAGPYQGEYSTLSSIEVTIAGPSGTLTQLTNSDGTAIWPDLIPGDYKVTIECPTDRCINDAYCSMRGSFANGVQVDHPVAAQVQNGTITTVAIGLAPKPAMLSLSAIYIDSKGEPNPIPAELELFQSDQHIGCFQVEQEREILINRPGLVTVRPKPYQRGGCTYYPEADEIMVLATSGELCGDLKVSYTLRLGTIEVDTCLVDAQGKRRQQPLPGAVIEIRRGTNPGGPPLRQAKTGIYPVRFDDLEPGLYTISLAHGPQLNNQQLEIVTPSNGRTVVQLLSGQIIQVDFCFQPCRARLQGMVLDSSCSEALAGVPLLLRDPNDFTILAKTVTNTMGAYEFMNLESGSYLITLAGDQVTLADGSSWEVMAGGNQQTVTVSGSGAKQVADFHLTREVHMIQGLVRTTDGEPVGNAVVQILDATGNTIALVNADDGGRYSWVAPNAGLFYVEVPQGIGGPFKRFRAEVNSVANVDVIVELLRPQKGIYNGRSGGQSAINEVTAFPFLTEEVDSGALSRRGMAGGSTSSTLVQNTFRDVLGWRVKGSDHKGFLTALGQSFSSETTNEQTTWRWTPRSYTVQVESGAITGAQASIYTRAKNALDQSLPLLEGLTSLGTDTDTDEELALRAIIESEFTELVNELGYEGGPRIQRVETLFTQLLGFDEEAQRPRGHLGELQEELGLEPENINTVEEEQNLTNFLVLVDYVRDIRRSWETQRGFFDRRGSDIFLGTQLVLIGRALTVISESVQEAFFTMDSVFMGAAERQSTELEFESGPMLIAEVLDWAEHFASEEGPRLIRDGGKAGVRSLFSTAQPLAALVRQAQTIPFGGDQDPDSLPDGYNTARVQRALGELQHHLAELARLTGQFDEERRNQDGHRRAGASRQRKA